MTKGYPKRRANEVKTFAHKESMVFNNNLKTGYNLKVRELSHRFVLPECK